MEFFSFLIAAVVVGWSSGWVYRDSKHNQISTDGKPYTKANGALAWLFACLLLWIVVFPAYMYVRSKRLAARRPARAPSSGGQVSSPAIGDLDEQLRKLAKLKDDGILSEEEFNQKKRSLLGLA